MLVVNDRIRVPLSEIDFRYVRSSGPGGQNVNKVSSKAVLRWAVATSPSLPDDVRRRFLGRFGSRVTGDGELVITSDRHRARDRNREDCLERLRGMLAEVATPPRRRRRTRPGRAAVERRLEEKRARSEKKRERRITDV
ncbi:MAG: alternative ribosome rescue aminoacyl-tRNA hydrolase ArfB [Candidatus Binatia bacterium]